MTSKSEFERRDRDWRVGATVYQVMVDRFAPVEAATLEAKRALFAPPRRLLPWDTPPARGVYQADVGLWSHELDFYGGDLRSLASQLDYIATFASALYLNPLYQAATNHKYGAEDFRKISQELGTWASLEHLIREARARQLRTVFDFVPNHCSCRSMWFESAHADLHSPYRDFFFFDAAGQPRCWADVPALPELRLENPAVRRELIDGPNSVLRQYLRAGFDGARVDVAFDVGLEYLAAITGVVHQELGDDGLVIGEVNAHPGSGPNSYAGVLDGVIQFYVLGLLLHWAQGNLGNARLGRLLQRMVDAVGIGTILRSWLILENHDCPRLTDRVPSREARRLVSFITWLLPGTVNMYYGLEVGMTGKEDPLNRAPMRWDLCTDSNDDFVFFKALAALRRKHRALRIGDFIRLETDRLLAFARHTDCWRETIVVVANATDAPITESICLEDPMLLQFLELDTVASAQGQAHSTIRIEEAGFLHATVGAFDALALKVKEPPRFAGMTPGGQYQVARRIS